MGTLNNGKEQRCVWLKSRASERAVYCQPDHSSGAYNLCEETCGKCRDDCNDTNGRFTYQEVERDCEWLSLRPAVMDVVCQQGFSANDVVCPETCDECDVPPPPPSHPPSEIPSQRPSTSLLPTAFPSSNAPSAVPSSAPPTRTPITPSPTSRPTCDDSVNGTFEISTGEQKTCLWLQSRETEQTIYCANSGTAYNVCEETCGK